MLAPPRRLLGATLLLLVLVLRVAQRPAPRVGLEEAAAWEGSRVTLEGAWEAGAIVDEGHRLEARGDVPEDPPACGSWVAATGRLLRIQGRLVLWLEDADDLRLGEVRATREASSPRSSPPAAEC